MGLKVQTLATCDVTGKEVEGTHLIRLRVTPLHALKQMGGNVQIEGAYPPLSDVLTVHRVFQKADGTLGQFEDVALDTLTETHEVFVALVPKGGSVQIVPPAPPKEAEAGKGKGKE